jgi:hypothetical protein
MPKALAAKSPKVKDTEQAQKHPAMVTRQPVPRSPGAAVLALQRSAGNHAVSQSLGQSLRTKSSTGGLLQRKCACGNNAMTGGECGECGKKKRLGLQTKLTINEPGDIYEREADRIADQVMATPAHPAVSAAPQRIQRFTGQSNGQMDAAPASVGQALANPGRPLEPALRLDMEQRFSHDFSRVRVHSDAVAEQSARDVNAKAYTVGHDIVFGAGVETPGTREGKRLIAHELAHVVQQSGSAASARIQRQPEEGRATSTEFRGENRALRDGVRKEKWSEELESQYRKRGHFARADAIRDCRLRGLPACRKILTSADLQALYDRNILPQQTADGVPISPPIPAAEAQVGVPNPAEGTKFGTPIAAAGTALAFQKGAAVAESAVARTATTAAQQAMTRWGVSQVVVPAAEAATATGASTAAEAGAASATAGATTTVAVGATVVLPAVIAGVHWYKWKTFQEKWIAAGYILLEDPLRICIGGCHLPSAPKLPQFPDFPDFPPVEPLRPFPFHPPQPLPPGWTELKPFEARREAPRETTKQEPKPKPKPEPKPDPRTKDRRRRKECKPKPDPCSQPLPIEWPRILPLPRSNRPLVRTPSGDPYIEPEARTGVQEELQRYIRRARQNGVPPPALCNQDEGSPNAPYDAHHIHPLFLGGAEDWVNVCALRADYHQEGHPQLYNQHAMLNHPVWIACKICEGNLRNHPAQQEYEIEGTK